MVLGKAILLTVPLFVAVCLIVKLSGNNADHERNRRSISESEVKEPDVLEEVNQRDATLRDHNLRHSLSNYGRSSNKVAYHVWMPDGVEIMSFYQGVTKMSRNKKRSIRDEEGRGQWITETINAKENSTLNFQLVYRNHAEEVISPNTKIFHTLYSFVKVLQPGNVRGLIFTPDYPSNYPNGAEIKWLLSFARGHVVVLKVTDYSMEECCDRLIVYDGKNTASPILGMVTGTTGSTNSSAGSYRRFTSSGSDMFLVFTSDCLEASRGFQATYESEETGSITTTPAPTSCGTVQTTSYNSGIVLSPNYPSYYDNNMNCTWFVQTASNSRARLTFNYFSLQYGDNLEIYDGTSYYPGNLVRNFTGYLSPGYSILMPYNRAYFVFSSDSYSTARGFNISYYGQYYGYTTTPSPPSTCSDPFYEYYSGNITSPGYYTQGYYENNLDCQWVVTTYSGTIVKFTVNYFSLEYSYDYVEISNQINSSLIVRFTGYVPPGTVAISSSNRSYVNFHTDGSITDRGFNLFYDWVYPSSQTTEPTITNQTGEPSVCVGTDYEYGSYGYILSPHYPSYYDSNLNCRWSVQTPYSTRISFTVQYFNLASGDFLSIYNGQYANNDSLIEIWYGYIWYGYTVYGNSNRALLEFSSDQNYESQGFYITYGNTYIQDTTTISTYTETTGIITNCSGNYSSNYGTILSPDYPYYENNLDCTWTVRVDSYYYVLFTVLYFSTEGCCDYVNIYQGTPPYGSFVEEWRGYVSPNTQALAHDNEAYMTFYTDSSITYQGFRITYSAVSRYYTIPDNSAATTEYPGNTTWWSRENKEEGEEEEGKVIGNDLWKGAKHRPQKKP